MDENISEKKNEKKKILIIEDEVDLAEMIKLHIEGKRKNYTVALAHDGELGLKAINEINPDLIVLDISLPKKGGIEIYKQLSAGGGQTRIPVLIFTGRAELEGFFENVNAAGFITKPFEMSHVLEEIDRILSA